MLYSIKLFIYHILFLLINHLNKDKTDKINI